VNPAYLADVEAGAGTFHQTTVVTGVPQQDDKFYGANNNMKMGSFHQASNMGQSQPEPEAEMSVPLSQSEAAKALHSGDDKLPKKKKAVKKGRRTSKNKLELPSDRAEEIGMSSDPSTWATKSEEDFHFHKVPVSVKSADLANAKPNHYGLGGAYN